MVSDETLEGLCVGPVESSSQAVFEGFPFRGILTGQLDSFRKEGLSSLEFFHSYFCCLFVGVYLNTRHKEASYLSYECFCFIFSLFITVPSIILLLTVLLCGKKNL